MHLTRWIPTLAVALLTGCGTPTQNAALTTGAITLGQLAVANNTTAAKLAQAGQTFCGQSVSPAGVLIGAGIVALANAVGVPVAVTGAASADVANACGAVGLVAGALPATTNAAAVPMANVPAVGLPVTPVS